MFGADFPKTTAGIIVVLICLIAWGYFSTRNNPIPVAAPAAPVSEAPQVDSQTRLDLIHLLDFSLMQSTLAILDRLIELATLPEVIDRFREGEHTLEAQESRRWYTGYVGQEISGNFHRRQFFLGIMANAEAEIDHDLEGLQDQILPGETLVALRRRLIVELQFRRVIQFLGAQRRELVQQIGARRQDLVERLNLRQQG